MPGSVLPVSQCPADSYAKRVSEKSFKFVLLAEPGESGNLLYNRNDATGVYCLTKRACGACNLGLNWCYETSGSFEDDTSVPVRPGYDGVSDTCFVHPD